MADELYTWKTDFSGQDTNTPLDEDLISNTLGANSRAIKSTVKKDLSQFNDTNNSYSSGKEYGLYKSETDARIALGEPYDLKLRNFDSTNLSKSSFTVDGNYTGIFWPGSRFVVSDSYSNFDRTRAGIVTGVVIANSITTVTYSPILISVPDYPSAISMGSAGFSMVVADPAPYSPGSRVVFAKTFGGARTGLPTSGEITGAQFIERTFSTVVKTVQTSGLGSSLSMYYRSREFAQEIEGLTETEANNMFPINWHLATPEDLTGFSALFASKKGVFNTDTAEAEKSFILVGAQTGNAQLNSIQGGTISVQTTVNGPIEAGASVSVDADTIIFPLCNLAAAGNDYRVKVQCVGYSTPTGTDLPSTVLNPRAVMNVWSTTVDPWDTLLLLGNSPLRNITGFALLFVDGVPVGTELVFDITVCKPPFNGKTFYQVE